MGEPVDADGDNSLQIGAGANPLLGDAMAALFLPVRRKGERFERDQGSGWAVPAIDAVDGRFRLLPPLKWWDGQRDGVLMLLVYDRSYTVPKPIRKRELPISLRQQLEREPAIKNDPTKPWPIGELPEPIRVQLEYQLEHFLQRLPAGDLELGLIELDRRATPEELTFAVASCQYPANFIDRDVAQRSYERLQARLTDAVERLRPRCLLLVGDQVYIDPTAGFFDPSTLSDRYDLPYERLLQTKPLRQVLRRVPLHTMLDDHEIEDNWEPPSGGVDNLEKGRKYYLAYQRMAWPPPPPPVRLWYRFEANGFPFFMADTRTERQPRDAGCIGTARIMKDDQFTELTSWLSRQDKDMPKFIATPAAFLPRHRRATHGPSGAGALRSDSWDGYRASFDALVKHVADNRIQNVVFLSGDEHISFATTAVVSDRSGNAVTRILSVHSSALYAPFAFANSTQENLAGDDSFDSGSYRLTVTSTFAAPGDGFALLRTWRDNGRWHVCCLFDREPPEPEVWIDLA